MLPGRIEKADLGLDQLIQEVCLPLRRSLVEIAREWGDHHSNRTLRSQRELEKSNSLRGIRSYRRANLDVGVGVDGDVHELLLRKGDVILRHGENHVAERRY